MSVTDVSTTNTAATVDIKSSWLSKTNWTQVVGVAATALSLFTANKFSIPAEQQVIIVGVIQGIQSIATWIIKTWFTSTVSPASLPKV